MLGCTSACAAAPRRARARASRSAASPAACRCCCCCATSWARDSSRGPPSPVAGDSAPAWPGAAAWLPGGDAASSLLRLHLQASRWRGWRLWFCGVGRCRCSRQAGCRGCSRLCRASCRRTATTGRRWCRTLCCRCCCAAAGNDGRPLRDGQPRRQQSLAAGLRLLLGGVRQWSGRRRRCTLVICVLGLLDGASHCKLRLPLLPRLQTRTTVSFLWRCHRWLVCMYVDSTYTTWPNCLHCQTAKG
jgi:hypothetical protein